MRKMLIAAALGGMMILPACAGGYGYYGASAGPADVYYDGFYGPYTEGYWGPDAAFYYRGGDGRFIRDESNHYRRGMFGGAHHYHSHGAPREAERIER